MSTSVKDKPLQATYYVDYKGLDIAGTWTDEVEKLTLDKIAETYSNMQTVPGLISQSKPSSWFHPKQLNEFQEDAAPSDEGPFDIVLLTRDGFRKVIHQKTLPPVIYVPVVKSPSYHYTPDKEPLFAPIEKRAFHLKGKNDDDYYEYMEGY